MRIDSHVHMVPFEELEGCHVSSRLMGSWARKMFDLTIRAWELQGPRPGFAYAQRLANWVDASTHLDAAVVLAMDGRYDDRGCLDEFATDIFVSNDCVHEICKQYPQLLFGASIHPLRRDAVQEVERVRERGAVLIKLLPSVQDFDPCDPRCIDFYRAAHKAGLPLLIHTGNEHTLPVSRQEYGHPDRLRLALDQGCTVIGAHAGMSGVRKGQPESLPAFIKLLQQYDNLYGDTSSLFSIVRVWYVDRIVDDERLAGRLLHGSDYPVPILALPWVKGMGCGPALRLSRLRNPLDRCAQLARRVGLDESVFTKAADVLALGAR